MNQKISIHKRYIEARRKSIDSWLVPTEVKKDMRRFLDELELGRVNKGRKIGEARLVKYADSLRLPLEFWNKDIAGIEVSEIEAFEKALSTGVVVSKIKNRPYMDSTKADIRKAIKIFFRWKLGAEKAAQLTDWLDTREVIKTPDYLKESQISTLLGKCRTAEQRFLIAVLFDSGARAEEFYNIRYEDIHLPEGRENYVKITLKEEYSKTKGRTIALYWKHSLNIVKDYLAERIHQGIKAKDPMIKTSYDGARQLLYRLGKESLGRSIHFHLFRHSSATYYASRMNRQALCYRFGWKFSSNMPDVYISRAGIEQRELDEQFANGTISDLKVVLSEQQQQNGILRDGLEKLKMENESFHHKLIDIQEQLKAMREYLGR